MNPGRIYYYIIPHFLIKGKCVSLFSNLHTLFYTSIGNLILFCNSLNVVFLYIVKRTKQFSYAIYQQRIYPISFVLFLCNLKS